MKSVIKITSILISGLIFCSACKSAPKATEPPRVPAPKDSCLKAIVRPLPAEDAAVVSARKVKAAAILAKMSLEDKAGQVIVAGVAGLDGQTTPDVFPQGINERQTDNLKKTRVGGVLFFGGSIVNDAQIKEYIADLQNNSKIPLFISTDEEGGLVSRLGNNPDISVTKFYPMIQVGNAGDIKKAFDIGQTLGREMHALGFNVDWAPVADVLTNPLNTVIREKGRAFGIEPEIVCAMVPQFVEGIQGQEVCAALKHFPGHGDVEADTHHGRAISRAGGERLRTVELLPFRAGIQAGADFVMAAHVSVPGVTGDDEPASMSKILVTDLLRGELGFKGVIVTDDIYMDAIRAHYGLGEAAVLSINAGVDLVMSKLEHEECYNAVLAAAKSGRISKARLDEAVLRILELKIKRGIIK